MAEEPTVQPPTPPQSPPPPSAPPSGGSSVPEGGLKVLLYIVSFLVPLAGIIIGVIFYTKDTSEEKKFGKMCIILAVVAIVVMCLCFCAFYGLTIGLAIFGEAASGM